MHTMAHEMGNKVDTVTILLAGSQGEEGGEGATRPTGSSRAQRKAVRQRRLLASSSGSQAVNALSPSIIRTPLYQGDS